MKSRDLFIVGARLIGLWYGTVACTDLVTVVDVALGIFRPQTSSLKSYIAYCVAHAMISLFLLLFAHRLADIITSRVKADEGSSSGE